MTRLRFLTLFFLVTLETFGASAQAPGIRTEYLKDDKSTHVETNMLYLLNTEEQFVQVMLRSWFKGQGKPASAPKKVDIEIFSFSRKPLFKDRSLFVITETEELKLGSLTDTIMKSDAKKGIDTFTAVDGNPYVGMQVPIPQIANLRNDASLGGLTMELMSLSIKPDQFFKFANSSKLEFKIGNATFPLNERHIEIIRNFAKEITPN